MITPGQFGSEQATIFSSAAFCRSWADIHGQMWQPIGPAGDLGVIYRKNTRLGLRKYELSPSGLYWGVNGENTNLSNFFIKMVSQINRRWNCQSLTWNFRYDAQAAMEQALVRLGPSHCKVSVSYTHVLELKKERFEQVINGRVKAVTRRQIRIGMNSGLEIREIKNQIDIEKHDLLMKTWIDAKGINSNHSVLIPKLASDLGSSALFLGAFKEDILLAAIFIIRDQREWFYFHGVRDNNQDKYFAMDVLLSHAIKMAIKNNSLYFNMGASRGIKPLEFFKERWGAEKRTVWSLNWKNPYLDKFLKFWRR